MSKRVGFQFRQPRAKMPKLDITISSSQRIANAGPSTSSQQARDAGLVEDAWCEDEEDEIFVLASQAVEQVQANAAVVISQAMNSQAIRSSHDISYNHFRQNVRPVHSTQINDNPMDVFDNDEEDIFSNVPDFVTNNAQPATENNEINGQAPAQQNNVNNHHHHHQQQQQQQQQQSSQNNVGGSTSGNTGTRNQMEEIQNKYYAEKIKTQKKEIEQLKESLNKLNQRCTTKEGEASTLRYEVHSKSTEIDRLRREKMQEAVEIEKKYAEKIAALEKKIETQRSELEFKNIEILNKKPRRSLNDSTIHDQAGPSSSSLDYKLNYMFKLPANLISSNDHVYTTAAEFLTKTELMKYRGISERDFDTLNSLSVLQSLYNGAKAKQLSLLDDTMMKEFKGITNALIETLKNYASRLTQRAPTKYNPINEYKTLSEETIKLTDEMAKGIPAPPLNCCEKLIYETQVLAVVAELCTEFTNTTQMLLFEKCEHCAMDSDENENGNGENRVGSFVDTLTDVLCAIGHSTTLSSHKSLIESASLLLVALAKSYKPTDASDSLLLHLFQAIVYCEPVLNSLNHLSEFLSIISENEASNICNRFCLNESNNVMSIQRYKIHRFSIDTCPLQVLSCLLQIAFKPYASGKTPTEQSDEVATVANVTVRMLQFLRNCFTRRVDWLFRRSRNESDAPQISYCYCYIVSCIVVLLHFCINSWMENHKNIDLKLIKTISSMGSLFLFDIIKKHFEPKVLSLGGFPVKNRLQAIYDWIMSYSFFVRVSSISENAMKSVNLRRISQLNEPQMASTTESQHHNQDDDVNTILQDSFDGFLM